MVVSRTTRRLPIFACFFSAFLSYSFAEAATVSGIVRDPEGNRVPDVRIGFDQPAILCFFCATAGEARSNAQGEFQISLPEGEYVVFADPLPPWYRDWQAVDARDGNVSGIELTLAIEERSVVTDTPPVADLIEIYGPSGAGEVTIAGLDGAVAPKAHVFAYNLNTGYISQARAAEDGSFEFTIGARAGEHIMVKTDAVGYHAATFDGAHQELLEGLGNDIYHVSPGTILRVPNAGGGPTSISSGGLFPSGDFTEQPPRWSFEGQVNTLQFGPGDELRLTGEMRAHSPALDAVESVEGHGIFKLELLSDHRGQPVMGQNFYASSMLTTTGLPIERDSRLMDEGLDGATSIELAQSGPGQLSGTIDVSMYLPLSLPEGYYRPHLYLFWNDYPMHSPPTQVTTRVEEARRVFAPVIRVGNPPPPRLFLTMLTDTVDNGSRGTVSREDRERWGLSARIATNSRDFVIPRATPMGTPISYRLEPFSPQVSMGDRLPPMLPRLAFRFPSGALTVRIKGPDGSVKTLGPAPFTQSRAKSLAQNDGYPVIKGGGSITDMYQLSTMDPRFEVQFERDGHHEITMETEIEDIWGNIWHGGGTYDVWVANKLVVDTTVLPGTPFEVGDSFHAGARIFPAVPAKVEAEFTIDPHSDPDQRIMITREGHANLFGYFRPSEGAIELSQPGEYRLDITASWEDEHGNLWMGSRTFGSVVAPVDSEITAHGRRGIDVAPEIGQAWFFRSDTGLPVQADAGSHINQPFFNGDIAWVAKLSNGMSDSLITTLSFDEPGRTLSSLIESRLGCCFEDFDGVGTFEERVAVGEIPLVSSRPDLLDPHFDPSQVDLWAYSYRSIQRPMVRVRELIAEDLTDSPYWRFQETYHRQVGMGPDGDRENDLKFQYGGVVLRGDALDEPRYGIYGSLAVLLPPEDDGSRVFPPFQGNGGGPSGGPILTHKGEDIDLLFHLRGARAGGIFEVGDTFSMAGVFGPTLPTRLSYDIRKPDGTLLTFRNNGRRRANPVGYYYRPEDDFVLDQPGLWTVRLTGTFDGRTSAGQVTEPWPSGSVLGAENERFHFYVTDAGADQLAVDLPEYSILAPSFDGQGRQYRLDVRAVVPEGYSITRAHATTTMPGTLLESRELGTAGIYDLDILELARDVPNLDTTDANGFPRLADALTVSLYVEAEDAGGKTHHLGRVVNVHGDKIHAPKAESSGGSGGTPFGINAGHSGAWFNLNTSGQGQLIDIEPESGFMFLAWFAYTADESGNPNQQHWFTAQGNYSGAEAVLPVYETLGGKFDDPQAVSSSAVGTLELSFEDCANGFASYTIDTWGAEGSFPLTRVIPGSENVCLGLAQSNLSGLVEKDGWDGAWYAPETAGQGFLVDVQPNQVSDDFIFVAWFTYGDSSASGQRWLTAQGPMNGTRADIAVYETTGGSFDNPTPVSSEQIGTMTIEFTNCNSASLTYELSDESLSGSIDLVRVVPGTEALCEELAVTN